MKFDSPLFDRIRVKPEADRRPRPTVRGCQHRGCREAGDFRAPKGRGHEGEYFWFCVDHVREYNASYNYFNGMSDDAVARYQKDAVTGHRPTWGMGVNGARRGPSTFEDFRDPLKPDEAFDPFNLFNEQRSRPHVDREAERESRMIRNAARKAFDTLGLEPSASAEEIKARFKDLAKRHHPDANGGDRSQEDRLREIIQAYKYLKQAGFC